MSRHGSHISRGNEALIRRLYEQFKHQRTVFLALITGDLPRSERGSYGSLLFCRIMFLYFLQARGLLDANPRYLAHHFVRVRDAIGPQTFYRSFLLRLFHEGFAADALELRSFFGNLPHLGADLFPPHPCEEPGIGLHIPDEAFAGLFDFFNQYQWHQDDQSPAEAGVINSALWGAIAELLVNQQQMGAYYTRADVTGYIVQYTLLPYLLEKMVNACAAFFKGEDSPWHLLRQNPARYIPPVIQDEDYLPDETEHEYQRRRSYYMSLLEHMRAGRITSTDDFITYNLDIQRFLLDALLQRKQHELSQICYNVLHQVTILDPTCGSGAFLFTALETLEPFYEVCLALLEEQQGEEAEGPGRYTILKSIVSRNLYGVDIMEEAIEICRLRLFLRIIAQIECIEDIEPLPALSQHLQVGNALVGESEGLTGRVVPVPVAQIDISDSHGGSFSERVFNWREAFGHVWGEGGFAVIIGNPPYVEYNVRDFPYQLQRFETLPCANLYTCVIERCVQLLKRGGRQGMILPLAAFATRNMTPFLESFLRWFPATWLSFYHFRPAMLFSGGKVASIPTAIFLAKNEEPERRFSTHLLKWTQEQRGLLFSRLTYCQVRVAPDLANRHYYPKLGADLENEIMEKIQRHRVLRDYLAELPGENELFYRSAGGLYWKVFVNFPWPYVSTSNKQCSFDRRYDRDVFVAVLNSSLFWWYYTVTFDTFNLKDYMLFGFRFTYPDDPVLVEALRELCGRLMDDYRRHARYLKRGESDSYTIYARKSKSIIDKIDRVLALHYGFSEKELEFLLQYDMKYRMGRINARTPLQSIEK